MCEVINIFDIKATVEKEVYDNLDTSITLDTSGLIIELNSKVVELPFVSFLDKTIGNIPDLYGSETFIRFDSLSKRLIYFIYAENIDSVSLFKIKEPSKFLRGNLCFRKNISNTFSWKECLISDETEEIFFCRNLRFKEVKFSKLLINSNFSFILLNGIVEGIVIDLRTFYLEKWNVYEFNFIKNYLKLISKENWLKNEEEQNLKEINTLMRNYEGNIFSKDINKLLEYF